MSSSDRRGATVDQAKLEAARSASCITDALTRLDTIPDTPENYSQRIEAEAQLHAEIPKCHATCRVVINPNTNKPYQRISQQLYARKGNDLVECTGIKWEKKKLDRP